jgi:hypothetical protein
MGSWGSAARPDDPQDLGRPLVASNPLKSLVLQPINFITYIPNCHYDSTIARPDQDKSRLLNPRVPANRCGGVSSGSTRAIIGRITATWKAAMKSG